MLLYAGLVEREKTGRESFYKLNSKRLRAIGVRWFDHFE
ncbi:MAG: DNA-binding transcriptional ArsR family regulator [Planctomycetota bacterium]